MGATSVVTCAFTSCQHTPPCTRREAFATCRVLTAFSRGFRRRHYASEYLSISYLLWVAQRLDYRCLALLAHWQTCRVRTRLRSAPPTHTGLHL